MPQVNFSDLQVNKAIDVPAPDTQLTIAIDPTKPMALGTYAFQLTVTDGSGNVSTPAVWRLNVVDSTAPTANITGPTTVPFGQSIILSARGSADAGGGTIAKYTWTLTQTP